MSQTPVTRLVRLIPASLALVLSRDPETITAAGANRGVRERSGAQLFAELQAENKRCYWNGRLARAVAGLTFQGWLEEGVLLVQGDSSSLEVLRDAWMRRALRAPRGFQIRALGDASPMFMTPVHQSQFIPLTEVLCSAIADMNAAHNIVTQETLMNHLVKYFPGIATPSADVIYNILGTLIKERKIYHTGEGYFIVTPQTYFITSNEDHCKRAVSDEEQPLPARVTYLVSMENSLEPTKENGSVVSHCKSCHCFVDHAPQKTHFQHSVSEQSAKGQKCAKECKPSIQHQAISTTAEHPAVCDVPKVNSLTKEKSNRKFGLSLFWRTTTKKEKPKKEYSTFSAQFPPEEWPVRDEENLDNIPRNVEHEIIKRINPELTVNNLMKHTLIMRKLEEHKSVISKGTSTEMLVLKQRLSKGCTRKHHSKGAKHRKKGHADKEKMGTKSKKPVQLNELKQVSEKSTKHSQHVLRMEKTEINNNCGTVCQKENDLQSLRTESQNVHRRQIDNPFQTVRSGACTKGHRSLKRGEPKISRTVEERGSLQRSRSLDSSRIHTFDSGSKVMADERHCGKVKTDNCPCPNSSLQMRLGKDISKEYNINFPESNTLGVQSKHKRLWKNSLPGTVGCENKQMTSLTATTDFLSQRGVFLHNEQNILDNVSDQTVQAVVPQGTSQSNEDQASNQCKNIASSVHTSKNDTTNHYRTEGPVITQNTSLEHGTEMKTVTKWAEGSQVDSEGFSDDDDQTLYQNAADFDDGCSSLYLQDECEDLENANLCHSLDNQFHSHFKGSSEWNNTTAESVSETSQKSWTGRNGQTEDVSCSLDSSCVAKRNLTSNNQQSSSSENCEDRLESKTSIRSGFRFVYEQRERAAEAFRNMDVSDVVDGSIFDYCHMSEADSDAETLQKSAEEGVEKSVHWSDDPQADEIRKTLEQKFELLSAAHNSILNQSVQLGTIHIEMTENHSITGDSGIDSPRTRVSLASNNSVILDGLKRRSFLQNLENLNSNARNNVILSQSSLLQMTPVMNV
ncbi:storkhead-box protein 1 [Protopterus annectens]|uniref:storkhead-box protein 1 n=1 Tax=Protopterus annectens TaxID=7888 RepID=UPI001CFAA85C|nr:storkhead-box protein 1 [Protopterus annectens]